MPKLANAMPTYLAMTSVGFISSSPVLLEHRGAIQTLAQDCGQANPAIIQLTGVYHNLLRRWADV